MKKSDEYIFFILIIFMFGSRILDSVFYDNGSMYYAMFEGFKALIDVLVLYLLITQFLDSRKELEILEEKYSNEKKAIIKIEAFKTVYNSIYIKLHNLGESIAFDVSFKANDLKGNTFKVEHYIDLKANDGIRTQNISKSIIYPKSNIDLLVLAVDINLDYILTIIYSDMNDVNKEYSFNI